jgi:hypothetical protein
MSKHARDIAQLVLIVVAVGVILLGILVMSARA